MPATRAAITPAKRALVVSLLALGAARAHADAPLSHASATLGIARNSGALGDRFGYGVLFGTEAAVHVEPDKNSWWDFGIAWTFIYGVYPATSDRAVEDSLTVVELGAVARARFRMPRIDLYAIVELGGELYRASVPIPPDDEQLFAGPVAGISFELAWAQDKIFTIGARYGLFGDGPTALKILFGVGVGL